MLQVERPADGHDGPPLSPVHTSVGGMLGLTRHATRLIEKSSDSLSPERPGPQRPSSAQPAAKPSEPAPAQRARPSSAHPGPPDAAQPSSKDTTRERDASVNFELAATSSPKGGLARKVSNLLPKTSKEALGPAGRRPSVQPPQPTPFFDS